MAQNKITAPLKKALVDLESGVQKKMDKAVQTISSSGNIAIIPALLDLLLKNSSLLIQKKVLSLLADIKDIDAKEIIIESLKNDRYEILKTNLINVVWNSKLDFSEYIAEFVALSTQGDLMRAIECLTVIENLMGPFEEHHLLESQLYLKDYYSESRKERSQKDELIAEIALFIQEQNDGIDADLLIE